MQICCPGANATKTSMSNSICIYFSERCIKLYTDRVFLWSFPHLFIWSNAGKIWQTLFYLCSIFVCHECKIKVNLFFHLRIGSKNIFFLTSFSSHHHLPLPFFTYSQYSVSQSVTQIVSRPYQERREIRYSQFFSTSHSLLLFPQSKHIFNCSEKCLS